jgi:hypothetical protein
LRLRDVSERLDSERRAEDVSESVVIRDQGRRRIQDKRQSKDRDDDETELQSLGGRQFGAHAHGTVRA